MSEQARIDDASLEDLEADQEVSSAFGAPDGQHIPALVQLASDRDSLRAAQNVAAKKLHRFDGERYPNDACAITLSVLMQDAGITVPDTYPAIALGNVLKSQRRWVVIPVGQQREGDVGSTCGDRPRHGYDHIYLVLKVLNSDEMLVADNQKSVPHSRSVSGKDRRTPTKFFLRAPSGAGLELPEANAALFEFGSPTARQQSLSEGPGAW